MKSSTHTSHRHFVCGSSSLALFTALAALACSQVPLNAADASAAEASLQIQSVRINRAPAEQTKRTPMRYFMEGTPGVNLQLLLTLSHETMLPNASCDVTTDTFVDDTYQNLENPGETRTYYAGNTQPSISEDGHTLLFSVNSARGPAEGASRVFVRGSVRTSVIRGKTLTATNRLMLMVGQEAMIGDFRTAVRTVSQENIGIARPYTFSVVLMVDGDVSRIQKIKVIGPNGETLNEDQQQQQQRFRPNPAGALSDHPTPLYLSLNSVPTEPVTIEYIYPETVQQVMIPFEAQVDLGIPKAGPVQNSDEASQKINRAKPWPPPHSIQNEDLPPRRPPFEPK